MAEPSNLNISQFDLNRIRNAFQKANNNPSSNSFISPNDISRIKNALANTNQNQIKQKSFVKVSPVNPPPIDPKLAKPVLTFPLMSQGVLPLAQSGDKKYPTLASVFTNNVQDKPSYSRSTPSTIKIEEYLSKYVRGKDYMGVKYGSEWMRVAATEIAKADGKVSIEQVLIKAWEKVNNRFIDHLDPQPIYRLSGRSTISNPSKDFEVLAIAGSPDVLGNDKSGNHLYNQNFNFDEKMFKCAVEEAYKNRCKTFRIVVDPDKNTLEKAISERAASCKKHGRKLYIVYRGHGNYERTGFFLSTPPVLQQGVSRQNINMQGSRVFQFSLDKISDFDENSYKDLLEKHCKDIETISIIGSCHSGAAITAIEHEVYKTKGLSVA